MPGESQHEPTSGEPDPTILTTEQMLRAIANLEKQTEGELAGEVALINERIESIRRELEIRETHRLELKTDGEKALNAAMASTEKAQERERQVTATLLAKTEGEVDELKDRMNTGSGRGEGIRLSVGVVVGSIAALASLVVVVNFLFYLAAR